MTVLLPPVERFDELIEPILRAARVPGAAIAVVAGGATVFAKGYGYRDQDAKSPMTAETAYPIASTTKAINATLLGMLVDEGILAWDVPVQNYLPRFHLGNSIVSSQVTLRDLVTMRTGLPRHDWLWSGNPISRAGLIACFRHLELSSGFRERFQYNNITVTAAGHVAEIVTGQSWEELVQQRFIEPLAMSRTGFASSLGDNVTLSYHENTRRKLLLSPHWASEVTAPSGGALYSTVTDMARWMLFNLSHGTVGGHPLLKLETLAEIHSPQVLVKDPTAPTPKSTYALGWFVDSYNACTRLSHSGYLHSVNSEIMLFPAQGIGIVSFTNFGAPALARLIGQNMFDLIMGFMPTQTLEDRLSQYEARVVETLERNAAIRRAKYTSPSHPLIDYVGRYGHPAYGEIEIQQMGQELVFCRHQLRLPLEHWHYDAWIAKDTELFLMHIPHSFDPTSHMLFETNREGEIAAVSISLEPEVAPIRFEKSQT